MGIAHAWNINFGHAQYCSDNLDQNNCANGVYKIPSRRNCFPSRFELLIFWNKERFLFECKTLIISLTILSSIHIKIRENIFLTTNTRWC